MLPDFNAGLAGFVQESAVWREVLAGLERSGDLASAKPKVRAFMESAAEAAFEMRVIMAFAPLTADERSVGMRSSLADLAGPMNSQSTRAFLADLNPRHEFAAERARSLATMIMTRQGMEPALQAEFQRRRSQEQARVEASQLSLVAKPAMAGRAKAEPRRV